MTAACATADSCGGTGPAPCAVAAMKDARRHGGGWAFFLFVVAFALRSFFALAIRRCRPGPVKWP